MPSTTVADRHALMPHQEEGVAFLLARGSGLVAFEQGLGKTLVAIDAFRRLRETGSVTRLVVLCPNSLKQNWASEVQAFAPELTTEIIGGELRTRRWQMAQAKADVVIMNYELARNELPAVRAILRRAPTALVLDESHSIKNRRSLTSTTAQHLAPLTEHRWLLSGTPVTNSAGDLYAQLQVVTNGTFLGSFDSFMVSYGAAATDPRQAEALAARVAPFVLRRTKAECLDLPEKTFHDVMVDLPDWQRAMYNEMRDNLVCEVRTMSGRQFRAFAPTALSRLLRLSQIASNPALVAADDDPDHVPAKHIALDRLISKFAERGVSKVIIWSNYVATIETLQRRLAHTGCATLYGGTPQAERQALATRFQTDPTLRVLVANPAAAGTGFTLTAATVAIYETLSWRYDFYAQSQDRNHRIGQTRPVTYLRLLARDTIEEVIATAVERKSALARSLLGDTGDASAITTLTPEQFCTMLTTNRAPLGPPRTVTGVNGAVSDRSRAVSQSVLRRQQEAEART